MPKAIPVPFNVRRTKRKAKAHDQPVVKGNPLPSLEEQRKKRAKADSRGPSSANCARCAC